MTTTFANHNYYWSRSTGSYSCQKTSQQWVADQVGRHIEQMVLSTWQPAGSRISNRDPWAWSPSRATGWHDWLANDKADVYWPPCTTSPSCHPNSCPIRESPVWGVASRRQRRERTFKGDSDSNRSASHIKQLLLFFDAINIYIGFLNRISLVLNV